MGGQQQIKDPVQQKGEAYVDISQLYTLRSPGGFRIVDLSAEALATPENQTELFASLEDLRCFMGRTVLVINMAKVDEVDQSFFDKLQQLRQRMVGAQGVQIVNPSDQARQLLDNDATNTLPVLSTLPAQELDTETSPVLLNLLRTASLKRQGVTALPEKATEIELHLRPDPPTVPELLGGALTALIRSDDLLLIKINLDGSTIGPSVHEQISDALETLMKKHDGAFLADLDVIIEVQDGSKLKNDVVLKLVALKKALERNNKTLAILSGPFEAKSGLALPHWQKYFTFCENQTQACALLNRAERAQLSTERTDALVAALSSSKGLPLRAFTPSTPPPKKDAPKISPDDVWVAVQHEGTTIISIRRELTDETIEAAPIRTALSALSKSDNDIVIDLTQIRFLGEAAVEALLQMKTQLNASGRALVLCGLDPDATTQASRSFFTKGLHQVFNLAASPLDGVRGVYQTF